MTISRIAANLAVATVLLALPHTAPAQQSGGVLRVIPHSNLAILDPIWTTAYMSRNHGYMIYDTLFGTDEKGKIQPQMVEEWNVSPDKRLWTFKLRKGLEFHDARPVTSEDVVASIARWSKRDQLGQKLATFVERMDSPTPDTFRIFLREPCGFVLEALGKPSANVPFIMPRRVAETDAFKQIDDYTGSGPYLFKRDEFKPGALAVYLRNPKYVPRKEPPSGTAGGKRVYVDRIEWILAARDPQTQVNALQKGEVDMIERVPFEQITALRADKNVDLVVKDPGGFQYVGRFNHLHPPFDKPAVRRAAIAAFGNQEAFLRAQIGLKDLYKACPTMFVCGTTYASTAGTEIQQKSNLKKAQELLKASGYDGSTVVILKPTDINTINKLPEVGAQLLRQAGFKVEVQAMDWQTMVARRARKEAPDKGGWNLFFTAVVVPDAWDPIGNNAISASCDKAWFGWACDADLEALRDRFARETDEAAKKKLADQIQARAFEIGTHAPLGEYVAPTAVRKGVKGLVIGAGDFYWNIRKE
ncbi:MAG TPA: ABC transporter substrate-binding protein [Burkholderiales bacterium]|nr:ABC transporter substrate-binding protein [Burkholderiales bacterium]